MTTRPYRSPVREAKALRTRVDILEALIDLLNDRGPAELSIRDLAARAGVGDRTVYRYFPDRAALLDGLMEYVGEKAEWAAESPPTTVEELLDEIPRTFARYDRHPRESRAAVLLNLDPARTATISRENRTRVAEILAGSFPDLDADDLAEAAAILHLLASSRTWLRFRDEEGLGPDAAARAARRAAASVVADLRRA